MCVLTEDIKAKSVTGYKVVYKDKKDNYRSLLTNQVYKDGDMPTKKWTSFLIKKQSSFKSWFYPGIVDPKSMLYCKNMIGKTSVFKYLNSARCIIRKAKEGGGYTDNIVIIKIKLTNNLKSGFYEWADPIFAGSHLEIIKEMR